MGDAAQSKQATEDHPPTPRLHFFSIEILLKLKRFTNITVSQCGVGGSGHMER